ncbi:MAG: isoleucine--tRNA ligase, partial [Patescibacteria group bacterium]
MSAEKKSGNYQKFDSLFATEEAMLEYWHREQVLARSLEKNPSGPVFSFYDGPPFITGSPHYATLLPSIAKDIIPRFQTMKGRRVRRVWGWDVHGLPAEVQVEKRLGLKSKRDIEKMGIDKFINECRQYVAETSDAWRWYIDHIGRWADLDGAYRTDGLSFMESVIWAFKQLYSRGLIYRGRRTSLYCPRCATPLSKFEVTMDEGSYREVEDPAVTVAFELADSPQTFLLAWTTTPWTLPANFGLAIKSDSEYVKVSTGGDKVYILAHEALTRYRDLDLEILETFPGKKLIGQKYRPIFEYFPASKNDWQIYPADFVNVDEGTGIVHIAPGYGEDDTILGEKHMLSAVDLLDAEGRFLENILPWNSICFSEANALIIEALTKRGRIVKNELVTHSYPHCHRCQSPLIYSPQTAWYLKVEPLRSQMLQMNKKINWIPRHFGPGRFKNNLETAPDWCLSRTRYWGTPIPVWQTDDGELVVVGSLAELEKLSGQKITDLHRPVIDQVEIKLANGKVARRVSEVLDCWFESGAMPFAQDHYPFDNQAIFQEHFPADFIVEYTGQLRGWFYYLHLLSVALFGAPAFKNVVVHGVMIGNDGRKMSKSFSNYPDPRPTIEKYGAEALRLDFMSSKIMRGEDTKISEPDIQEASRLIKILHHVLGYFVLYAPPGDRRPSSDFVPKSILDRWIVSRLQQTINLIDRGLTDFNFVAAAGAIRPFVEDLSTWYIRRNRDRFVKGEEEVVATMSFVLEKFALAIAPILPFSAEYIWRSLGSESSVHLADFPSVDEGAVTRSADLMTKMGVIRELASVSHQRRAEANLPLRQPLAKLFLSGCDWLNSDLEWRDILIDEVNVKEVVF